MKDRYNRLAVEVWVQGYQCPVKVMMTCVWITPVQFSLLQSSYEGKKKKDTQKKNNKKKKKLKSVILKSSKHSLRFGQIIFLLVCQHYQNIERYDSLSRRGHDVVKMNLCPTDIFIQWTSTLKLRSLLHETWFKRVNKSSMQ